ncbi:zinc ribbon-containing protein [Virgibacillus sp. W0181]
MLMPTTGEKPGKGTYKCKNCGNEVTLDDTTDTLPPCANCDGTEFRKV